MVNLYVKLIKQGKMTVEDVPERWREQVRERLEDENNADTADASYSE